MITTAKEYHENLHLIKNENPPVLAHLPSSERVYKINVNTREIETPEFLGVERDHNAETIYFEIDRFVDYMDLTSTSCVISYINAEGEFRIYVVPFYDIFTRLDENKILFPWCLDKNVTALKGKVQFSIRFFKVGIDPETQEKYISYNLNLLPAESKIMEGVEPPEEIVDSTEEQLGQSALWFEKLQGQIDDLRNYQTLKWIIMD